MLESDHPLFKITLPENKVEPKLEENNNNIWTELTVKETKLLMLSLWEDQVYNLTVHGTAPEGGNYLHIRPESLSDEVSEYSGLKRLSTIALCGHKTNYSNLGIITDSSLDLKARMALIIKSQFICTECLKKYKTITA